MALSQLEQRKFKDASRGAIPKRQQNNPWPSVFQNPDNSNLWLLLQVGNDKYCEMATLSWNQSYTDALGEEPAQHLEQEDVRSLKFRSKKISVSVKWLATTVATRSTFTSASSPFTLLIPLHPLWWSGILGRSSLLCPPLLHHPLLLWCIGLCWLDGSWDSGPCICNLLIIVSEDKSAYHSRLWLEHMDMVHPSGRNGCHHKPELSRFPLNLALSCLKRWRAQSVLYGCGQELKLFVREWTCSRWDQWGVMLYRICTWKLRVWRMQNCCSILLRIQSRRC